MTEERAPPDSGYWCQYATDWTEIKGRRLLTMTARESEIAMDKLGTCPVPPEVEVLIGMVVVPGVDKATPEPKEPVYRSCEEAEAAGEHGCRGARGKEGDSQRRRCLQQETATGAEWSAKDDVHRRNTMTLTGQARPTGGAPDPVGLAVAREIQERVRPAEVILLGSRAVGDHRPDSDVDLMAVCPGEDGVRQGNRTVRQLLEWKREAPVVKVTTIIRGEFARTAPLGQSFAGQAARHGVTPDGKRLDYLPERDP